MKIRKRLSIIGVVLSIFFNSVFAYASDNNEVAGSSTESLQVQNFATCESMLALPDLNSLEENSDIIIKGKILPEHENVTLSALGYTRTKVQITKVYKGNVQVNDPILMDEEYWEVKDIRTGKKSIQALNLYKPCVDGNEYILFLANTTRESARGLNMYEILNITQGRFPVLNEKTNNSTVESKSFQTKSIRKVTSEEDKIEEMSNDELNLNEGDITQYKKLFVEVSQKYS